MPLSTTRGEFTDDLIFLPNSERVHPVRRRIRSTSWTYRRSRIVSVAASLIPFLEHDDANRAPHGVRTCSARAVADLAVGKLRWWVRAWNRAVANRLRRQPWWRGRGGSVDSVDASRIVVRVNDDETTGRGGPVSTSTRSRSTNAFQPEHLHQSASAGAKPAMRSSARRRARGRSVDGLGRASARSARICWWRSCRGMATTSRTRFSSPSVWSRKIAFTTIHIEELTCVAARHPSWALKKSRRTFPMWAIQRSAKLDEAGIAFIGAEVRAGPTFWWAKVTARRARPSLTPEEKLLRAIFGEEGLRCERHFAACAPRHGRHGDRRGACFTRDGVEKGLARHWRSRNRNSSGFARTWPISNASWKTICSSASAA